MRQLIEYFRRLTLGGNKESSKRFIALYIGVILITYVVLRYTDANNAEIMLGELIAFVLTLLGIASYESIKGVNKQDHEQ
jgi:hypothetical protein